MYFGQREEYLPDCQRGRETVRYQGAWSIPRTMTSIGVNTRYIGAIRTSAFPLTHPWSNPKISGPEVLGGRTAVDSHKVVGIILDNLDKIAQSISEVIIL